MKKIQTLSIAIFMIFVLVGCQLGALQELRLYKAPCDKVSMMLP